MNTLDKSALKHKYATERAKRVRPDGNDQYVRTVGRFASFLADPYLPVVSRRPKSDHVRIAVIGGGFAGLLTGARLKQAGVGTVRMIEKGGDFGGTWYWNRYPGAQCDTASLVYMPLLEETGHMPSEKYAHGPEILSHCRRIGEHFGLYDDVLFHTEVTELTWDSGRSRWNIGTNRGDQFSAHFVVIGPGPLHVPKLPGIPGLESFNGRSFHTSRWDYGYTGGDPSGAPMDQLADRRVGIIGTGATAVQCVPHLAKACQQLYVFQRTPSSVDVRGNVPTDPQWSAQIAEPGWQERWLENFAANQSGELCSEDLVMDGWTELARRVRNKILSLAPDELTAEAILREFEDADFEKMEEIRARIDAVVSDSDTAGKLKPWYRQLCKRPCFHDEYLQSYNLPTVQLVDTDGKGVDRITRDAVVVDGVDYQVDCIIYASGFEVGTSHTQRMGFNPNGRDGRKLSEHWAEGMRTKHGIHTHGFPNLFIAQAAHGANLISNIPHNLAESGATIATVIKHAINNGFSEVEVAKGAENAWTELVRSGPDSLVGSPDCTPGYYNNEGQPSGPGLDLLLGYPKGPMAYLKYIKAWRTSGEFEGLNFRRLSAMVS